MNWKKTVMLKLAVKLRLRIYKNFTPGSRIPLARAIESASAELRKMTKEEVRSLEGEKDVDCSEQEERSSKEEWEEDQPPVCTVHLDSLR